MSRGVDTMNSNHPTLMKRILIPAVAALSLYASSGCASFDKKWNDDTAPAMHRMADGLEEMLPEKSQSSAATHSATSQKEYKEYMDSFRPGTRNFYTNPRDYMTPLTNQ
jgi:hypothetical protein